MKRLIAILLISFHLFQVGGRFALHEYLEYQTDKFFNEQAAKGKYNIHDLTEIRIPVNLPAMDDWQAYENICGQIQFQNTCYNYVKMKLTHHCMYLMCVPNYEATQLISSNIIAAGSIKVKPVSKKEHLPVDKKATAEVFQFSFVQFAFKAPVKEITSIITGSVPKTTYQSLDIPEQPPKHFY